MFNGWGDTTEGDLHLAAEQVGQHLALASIRHVHQIDAAHHLEQLGRHMGAVPVVRRRHVDLARIGLAVGDQFGNRLGGK